MTLDKPIILSKAIPRNVFGLTALWFRCREPYYSSLQFRDLSKKVYGCGQQGHKERGLEAYFFVYVKGSSD